VFSEFLGQKNRKIVKIYVKVNDTCFIQCRWKSKYCMSYR